MGWGVDDQLGAAIPGYAVAPATVPSGWALRRHLPADHADDRLPAMAPPPSGPASLEGGSSASKVGHHLGLLYDDYNRIYICAGVLLLPYILLYAVYPLRYSTIDYCILWILL